jgi:hypothetical protein
MGLLREALGMKVGMPIVLLGNLDQKRGLCNGTRLIVKLFNNMLSTRRSALVNMQELEYLYREYV